MITKLHFQNFRGFRDLTVEPLKRINLLLGGNDSGKTSVLEGIYLLLADHPDKLNSFPFVLRNNQSGGQPGPPGDDFTNFWRWVFYDQQSTPGLRIMAKQDDGNEMVLKLGSLAHPAELGDRPTQLLAMREGRGKGGEAFRLNANAPIHQVQLSTDLPKVSVLSVRPTNPVQDAELYNLVALQRNGERKMEELMRVVEPRLQRLRYSRIPGSSSPLVYADLGLNSAVPSTQMGHAFSRILHIYSQVLVSKAEVFLIDEIENGIHHEVLPLFWKGLFNVCATEKVQIFATTHSWECVLAADEAAREQQIYDLNLIRLDRAGDQIKATIIDEKTLKTAAALEWEMR